MIKIAQTRGARAMIQRFIADRRGASAVEFAILSTPFLFMLMAVAQVGIFYVTQSALESGVMRTAINLRGNFTTGTAAALPSAGQLKGSVAAAGGNMIANDGNLAVEIRQIGALSSGLVPITDGTADYGSTTSTLVLRAQAKALTLAPGLGGLTTIYSSALIRRQGT